MRAHFPTATKLSVLAVSVILGGTLAGCSSDDAADEVASRPDIPLQSLVVGAADAPTWYSLNSELMQKIQQDKKKFIDDKKEVIGRASTSPERCEAVSKKYTALFPGFGGIVPEKSDDMGVAFYGKSGKADSQGIIVAVVKKKDGSGPSAVELSQCTEYTAKIGNEVQESADSDKKVLVEMRYNVTVKPFDFQVEGAEIMSAGVSTNTVRAIIDGEEDPSTAGGAGQSLSQTTIVGTVDGYEFTVVTPNDDVAVAKQLARKQVEKIKAATSAQK